MMSARRLRDGLRLFHLAGSVLLGFVVYAPPEEIAPLRLIVQVAVFPLMAVSGFWLWQQARVRRWLKLGQAPERAAK